MGIIFVALITMGGLGVVQYLVTGFVRLLTILIDFYWWSTLLLVIASFISQGNYHPALSLLEELLAPLMTPLRNILADRRSIGLFTHGTDFAAVDSAAVATAGLRAGVST